MQCGSCVILVPGGGMRTVVSWALISDLQKSRSHLPSTSSQNSSPPSTPSRKEHKSFATLLAQGPMAPMIRPSLDARVCPCSVSPKRAARTWQCT